MTSYKSQCFPRGFNAGTFPAFEELSELAAAMTKATDLRTKAPPGIETWPWLADVEKNTWSMVNHLLIMVDNGS